MGLDKIIDAIKKFIRIEIELVKLELRDNFIDLMTSMIIFTLFLGSSLFVLLFISLAVSFYLNEVLQSSYIGFLVVAAFYLFLIILLFLFKGKLIISNIVKNIFGKSLQVNEKEKNHE